MQFLTFDIPGEENAAVNTQQKGEVAVNADNVQGESNLAPEAEGETNDYFHENDADLSSNTKDPNVYAEGDKQGLL